MQRILWLGSAIVVLLVAGTAVIMLRGTAPDQPQPARAAEKISPAAQIPAAPQPQPQGTARPPSFDVVSVDPRGQAVIAGRALPGDRVKVLDGDKVLGEVTADARGEWVLVPDATLPPGSRQLALEATGRDGGAVRRSSDTVALSINPPAAGKDETSALAVLLPSDKNGAVQVLQRPSAPGDASPLALESAEYGDQDRLVLAGRAEPGARLNVYAGDRLLGAVTADTAGKWTLASNLRRPATVIELRLDRLAADGAVAQRIAAPLNLPSGVALKDGDTYVVRRGNSLWLIARQMYGEGLRYLAIYDANRNQIRDPDLIYPGQQFKLPKS